MFNITKLTELLQRMFIIPKLTHLTHPTTGLIKRWKGKKLEACNSGETKWSAFIFDCENGHNDVVQLLLDHSESSIELNSRDNL